ncbi:MAG: hypothetical protein PWP23_397 [Candidatus Sumerlaeota bacterium]|nr:hypothetical protein [Candidatus Sumerlaeota bacterium]
MKPITGTFIDEITWDIPSQNWGAKEWRREFDTMRQAGIDTVIIIRASRRDEAIFPSEVLGCLDAPDLAQLFLDEAHRCGMKLFFPSHDSAALDPTWSNWRADWEVCRKFLPEVMRRYGDHPAFHGWYIAPENCHDTPGVREIYQRYSSLMKELAPEKPVLISPWYPSDVYEHETPEARHANFRRDWENILRNTPAVDIAAFQDGACTCRPVEQSATYELADYIREAAEVCAQAGVALWNNAETFGRRFPIRFPPIDWRTLKRKLEICDPYAEKHITFEFSHFMSPNSMYPSARTLYDRYREEILGETEAQKGERE